MRYPWIGIGLPLNVESKIKLDETSDCWIWGGARGGGGYGHVMVDRRLQKAHRVVYERIRGPILAGLTIDHLCRNRACVNPQHLEAITSRENTLRGNSPSAIAARKTHCHNGHEFTDENTYRRKDYNGRQCRTCHRITQRGLARKKRQLKLMRDQQLRAAEALQQPEPPAWARLALFDAFTEELFLVGAFDRVEVDQK